MNSIPRWFACDRELARSCAVDQPTRRQPCEVTANGVGPRAPGNLGPVRALVQRVESARVTSEGILVGEIGVGLCVLVGVTHSDTDAIADKMAARIFHLRIVDDDDGVMNLSVAQTSRCVLVVSQFTLYGDTTAGRRPSWIAAARPEQAEPLVDRLAMGLRLLGATVQTGRFRTNMQVSLVNDGPVTVMIELP